MSVDHIVKQLFLTAASRAGIYLNPSRLTKPEKIRQLMNVLQPIIPSCGFVHIGPDGDGGYVIPNDISNVKLCFSPGVGNSSLFELDLAQRGMQIYMADKSVHGPSVFHPYFHFIPKFVGSTSSSDYITMDEWVRSCVNDSNEDMLLQMDIESAEYETILAMPNHLMNRFRIIVVEFHKLDRLWDKFDFSVISKTFEKILLNHACVHAHPNIVSTPFSLFGLKIYPCVEYTFLRRDRIYLVDHEIHM